MKRSIGVCYYPEQWHKSFWRDDAKEMAALGIVWVRINEFAWSKLEPQPGELHFEWLDEIIEILGGQKLKVILGTPTAAPNRNVAIWLLDDGQVFGHSHNELLKLRSSTRLLHFLPSSD